VKELERELQQRYHSSIRSRGFQETISDGFESLRKLYKRSVQKQQPSNPELPLDERRPPINRTAPGNTTQQPGQCNSSSRETLRLLLCVDEGNSKTLLQQVDLDHISEDRELFLFLRSRYFARHKRFTVKSVGSVSLSHVCKSPNTSFTFCA
jgi:hypothetical protein